MKKDNNSWLLARITGRPPRLFGLAQAIQLFAASTLPAYFALTAFGYNSERLDIPLTCAGIGTVAACWLVNFLDWRIWERNHETWSKRLTPNSDKHEP